MDGASLWHIAELVFSLATAVYLVHYKFSVDKRDRDEQRRFSGMETDLRVASSKIAELEKNEREMKAEQKALIEKHSDFKRDINDKFEKMDSKLDKLVDKLDQVLIANAKVAQ